LLKESYSGRRLDMVFEVVEAGGDGADPRVGVVQEAL